MGNQTIKCTKITDGFQECVESTKTLIEFMKQEIDNATPILKLTTSGDYAVENAEDIYQGFNRTINGALGILDEITEPYVQEHEDEIWLLRDAALALYNQAEQLFYESQGR